MNHIVVLLNHNLSLYKRMPGYWGIGAFQEDSPVCIIWFKQYIISAYFWVNFELYCFE